VTAYDTALDVDSPVSHWKLGEPSGAAAIDRKAVQDGVVTAGTTMGVAGLLTDNTGQNAGDTAMSFVPNQIVAVADNASHRPASFSAEFWIKIPSSFPADFKGIWFKSSGDSWNDGYGFTWRNPAGTASIEWWCNNFANAVVIPVTGVNEILHVVGTFTGGTIRAYKNGVAVGTPINSITVTHSTNSMYMSAGSTTSGNPFYYMTCTLDEPAIYSSALSAGAIANHYAAAAAPAGAPSFEPPRMPLGV